MLQVNQQDLNQVREAMCHWLRQKMPEADAIDIPPLHAPAGGGSSQTIFLSPVIQQDGKRREEYQTHDKRNARRQELRIALIH